MQSFGQLQPSDLDKRLLDTGYGRLLAVGGLAAIDPKQSVRRRSQVRRSRQTSSALQTSWLLGTLVGAARRALPSTQLLIGLLQ